jgi:DNA primase
MRVPWAQRARRVAARSHNYKEGAVDRYQQLREMPFAVAARALGIDEGKFRPRKNGTEASGPCPVHGGSRSNTAFSYASDGRWHCFSCMAKGKGAIDLAMAVRGVGFQDAVALLEPHAGAAMVASMPRVVPATRTVQEQPTQNKPFDGSSYRKYAVESEWLQRRNLAPGTLERFGVFHYDNPARKSAYRGKILLPVRRWGDGELVAYLARTPEPKEGEPKYVWPNGFHKSLELLGAWQLRNEFTLPLRIVYLVESPFAVMAFHQMGLPAVSPFGWSVSEAQANVVAAIARGVVCLPDRDKSDEFDVRQLSRRMVGAGARDAGRRRRPRGPKP